MHSDELLFLCELIRVQPDREKRDFLFEEVLNQLVEGRDLVKPKVYMQSPTPHLSTRPPA